MRSASDIPTLPASFLKHMAALYVSSLIDGSVLFFGCYFLALVSEKGSKYITINKDPIDFMIPLHPNKLGSSLWKAKTASTSDKWLFQERSWVSNPKTGRSSLRPNPGRAITCKSSLRLYLNTENWDLTAPTFSQYFSQSKDPSLSAHRWFLISKTGLICSRCRFSMGSSIWR